jgi:hypothetical protein
VKRDLASVGSAAPLPYTSYEEAVNAGRAPNEKGWALQPLRVAALIRLSVLADD